MKVEKDKVVTFHYTLRLSSGEIFDATTTNKPVHILVGHHQVIPGLEKAIMGMKEGGKKEGTIKPEDAYGFVKENLIKVYPRQFIPGSIALHIGRIISARKKNGQMVKAVVKSYTESEVVLDVNHPVAGKSLSFLTKIVHIREATQEELLAGMAN